MNNEVEVWLDVVGYEKLYKVSSFGRIKSLGNKFKRKEKILKTGHDNGGYLFVVLSKNGKRNIKHIHRLVAEAFLDMDFFRTYVDHIDRNKQNNNINNLRWVTHSENLHNCKERTNTSNPFYAINLETKEKRLYTSQAICSRELNIASSIINNILHRRIIKYKHNKRTHSTISKTSSGYTFEFA